MFIYNITTKVDWSIHKEWLNWMKEEQIPEMLASGVFHRYQMVKLLQEDDADGPTYAVQYYAQAWEKLNHWLTHVPGANAQVTTEKWKDKCIFFETIMEVVN